MIISDVLLTLQKGEIKIIFYKGLSGHVLVRDRMKKIVQVFRLPLKNKKVNAVKLFVTVTADL